MCSGLKLAMAAKWHHEGMTVMIITAGFTLSKNTGLGFAAGIVAHYIQYWSKRL